MSEERMDRESKRVVLGITTVLGFVFFVVLTWLVISPIYRVWSESKRGEAELKRAEYTRKIIIETAKAKNEAAVMEAEAEVVKAGGLAKAITIVGEKAKEYPEYRYQHFIDGLTEALREGLVDQVIYLPTEAGMPILESSRFHFHDHKTKDAKDAKIPHTEKKIAE
jgi:hypothetical protein